ncbi:MAG: cation:proton antiporter [Candidatus Cloacimonadota bacterium]|jgi:multisubunit Na+/H+ antiporter MnhC subunit|nr:MAG: cation:proton antiporter [Candidatus Cloacimonadota bacterium]
MIVFVLCFLLFFVGLYGVLTKRNLIKIIIGLAVMEYSVNLFFILIGYVKNGTAPILLEKMIKNGRAVSVDPKTFVDPLPQALILTAIVIGLATTGLLLAVSIRLYRKYGTFNIRKINSLKG